MYLLDSNAWIVHLRSRGMSKLSQRLKAAPSEQIKTCAIVRGELLTGAAKSSKAVENIDELRLLFGAIESFPFDDAAADIYAKIRAGLEISGKPIGGNDLMIAAIALAHDFTLVTHNTSEFSRVGGLRLEDWQ